jgi:hypothetical protein
MNVRKVAISQFLSCFQVFKLGDRELVEGAQVMASAIRSGPYAISERSTNKKDLIASCHVVFKRRMLEFAISRNNA